MFRLQSLWARYGLAAVGTLAISLIYLLSQAAGVMSDLRYFGFILVVLASAILCGLGPGLMATGLAALISAYLFLPPIFSIRIASDERTALLILFLSEGVLLSIIGSLIRDVSAADIATSWPEHYLPAALFVCAATGLKLLGLREAERELPFTFFYAAITASAWAGGFGAGVAATLLSSLSARYFFLAPRYSLFVFSGSDATRASLFILEGIVITYLSAKHQEARRIAADAIRQLRYVGRQLHASTADARALRTLCRDDIWELNLASESTMSPTTEGGHLEPASVMDFTRWLQEVHPKDRLKAMESLRSALEQGRTEWFYEYRRRRPGRGYVRVSDHAYIIRDDAWTPVRVVARSADQAELNASVGIESEGPYRAFFENNPKAVLLADKGLHILEANDAACDLLGYRRAELTKLNAEQIFEERKRGSVMDMFLGLEAQDRPSIAFEEECVRADGEVFRAKISAARISEIEGSRVDRMITIKEIVECETNS